VELRNNRIDGLVLTKNFDLSDFSGSLDGQARFVIESGGTVEANRLLLKTPALEADEATFNGLEISESDSDDLEESFEIRAPSDPMETRQIDLTGGSNPGLELEDADIRATYLATNEITLPGLELRFEFDPDGDGEYEFS
jgi:hypothetical protein